MSSCDRCPPQRRSSATPNFKKSSTRRRRFWSARTRLSSARPSTCNVLPHVLTHYVQLLMLFCCLLSSTYVASLAHEVMTKTQKDVACRANRFQRNGSKIATHLESKCSARPPTRSAKFSRSLHDRWMTKGTTIDTDTATHLLAAIKKPGVTLLDLVKRPVESSSPRWM